MTLTRYAVDGTATVTREYAGQDGFRFVVPRPGGSNADTSQLAHRAIADVHTFMQANDLI